FIKKQLTNYEETHVRTGTLRITKIRIFVSSCSSILPKLPDRNCNPARLGTFGPASPTSRQVVWPNMESYCEGMAKYLARTCPRCNGYLGIIMRKPARNSPLQLSTGVVWRVAIDLPGYSCKAESQPCGLSLLVVHHTKTLGVAAWQEGCAQCSRMSFSSSYAH